ncbi:MAG: FAD:protein FMN transferase [Deltaproteobacteria bacterium]|nr:FAD:protein FMN transferase [Deltaproteobacteria bacterium]
MSRLALLLLYLTGALACARGTMESAARVDVALDGETMGSTWHVKLSVPADRRSAALAMQHAIDTTLERINDEMSTYRPSSELSRFNAAKSTAPMALSGELAEVMASALEVGRLTDRAYDVTLDPLIDLWGFDRSGRKAVLPTAEQISAARAHVGLDKLVQEGKTLRKLDPELSVNLGGIAAGFAVDVVCADLDAAGFTDYMVEITGEVRARGTNAQGHAWRIGIKVPERRADAHELVAAVSLADAAVTTSGTYHNFSLGPDGKRYSHIIDPRTGAPVESELVSVTVLYADALTADAFDTAFVILGEQRAREIIARLPGMGAYFIRQANDGALSTSMTEGFPLVITPAPEHAP